MSPERIDGLPLAGGADELATMLGPFVARQGWAESTLGVFGAQSVPIEVADVAVLRRERPGLASVVVNAGGTAGFRLHVLIGWRDLPQATASLLRPGAVIGTGADEEGEVLLYDALADGELCLELLSAATEGRERAERVRVVQSLVSHSALIFDERLFMKCYRVIEPPPRPEIEMMTELDRVGFNHILTPVAHWSRGSADLGLVREFLAGAVEGKALALTSLRDLLARAGSNGDASSFEEVGLAGGDLGDEMRRLGETTAELHLALAEAFGVAERRGGTGREIRIHGDYHLRRVMRFDSGWLVAGFGDDPLIGPEAGSGSQGRGHKAFPLEDVADLFVSLRQVADEAVALQAPSTLDHAGLLAAGWVRHNSRSFLNGYLRVGGIGELVPQSRGEVEEWLGSRVPERVASLGR